MNKNKINVGFGLPVLGVVRPHSRSHRGPDDDQQFPQPYWGEDGPVAPLDDPIQPQRQQHGEQQQARVDQELTATGEKRDFNINTNRNKVYMCVFMFKVLISDR